MSTTAPAEAAARAVPPATQRALPRERIAGLDLLRVVGLLAVIAAHAWPADGPARDAVMTCDVSIFFFLCGYLWVPGRPMARDLARRSRALLVPYLGCLVVVGAATLLLAPETATRATAIRDLAGGVHTVGRPLEAFWFVTALFAATACYRLLDRCALVVKWAIATASTTAGMIAGPVLAQAPFSIGTGLTALVFLVGGETLALYRTRIPRRGVIALVALVIAAFTATIGASRPLHMKAGDLGTPVLSVVVALVVCGASTTLAHDLPVPRRARVVSAALARTAVGVVLVHPLVLWVLHSHGIVGGKAFLATVVVGWGLALIVERTPLAMVLLGAARRPMSDARVSTALPATT